MATSTASYTISSADWAGLVLNEAGAQAAPNSIANLQRMITAESAGNKAGFLRDNNPLNLNTWASPHASLPGGTIVHEFGIYVQTFPTVLAGAQATANQIKQNPAMLKALQNNAPASVFGGALSTSAWKAQSYANATAFPKLNPFAGSSLTTTLGGTPSTGGAAGSAIAQSIPGVSTIDSIDGFIKKITEPNLWKNVGIFIAGLGLVITGTLILVSSSKAAKSAGKLVAAVA